MAKETIAKFFDAAMIDKALAGKVAKLAAENGYDFTAAELLELGAARPVSDEETEMAAGGAESVLMAHICTKCNYSWMDYERNSKCSRCGTNIRGFLW